MGVYNESRQAGKERTGCEVADVKPESTFSELGIDSLDTVELLMNLEYEIGIEIELDQKVELPLIPNKMLC